MNLRDTWMNDPIYWEKEETIDAQCEDVTEQEKRQMADEDEAAMMREDGDMLRIDHLEPLTSDEAFEYFNSKSK